MSETTSIITQPNGRSGFSLAPTNLAEAMEFAGHLARSSLVPKDFQGNPGNIIVAVQWGAEIGLAPLQAMQSIAVVNGRPSIWGDAMIALVKGSGLLESIVEEIGDTAATCTVKRKGEAATSRTFTLEDAKRAGLLGKQGPWQQYTKRMLQMRARAWALRDVFPDVLRGVLIAEEARDIPPEPRDMGPADEVKPAPQSRAERARAALKKAKAPEAAQPAIEENRSPALLSALRSISAAQTMDELKATGDAAQGLTEFEVAVAKAAYKVRRQELMAAPIDADTGEVFPPLGDDVAEATETF
jgi:hypothetical protein